MKLTDNQTSLVCRSLALLLHSGISLEEGICLLTRDLGGELAPLMEALERSVSDGMPLSQAIDACGAFPSGAAGLIRVGEETGRMEQTLSYLADFYEEQAEVRYQIKQALTYPVILFLLLMGVLVVLLTEVLPVFDGVYASLGGGLTGVGAGLLRLGALLKASLPAVALLLGLGMLAAAACRYLPGLRRPVTRWLLAVFGDRGIRRKFNNALVAHGLAMGLASGMQEAEALALSCAMLDPVPAAADRCRRCREQLDAGVSLDQALEDASLLPGRESRILALGLRSGCGDRVMGEIARRLSQDASRTLEEAVSRLEPAMVLICAALVGLVLLAVMLPLMNVLAAIG